MGSEKHLVCLDFGSATPTLIEGPDDLLLEEPDQMADFRFSNTDTLSSEGLLDWINSRLNVIFDGDLDEPEKFASISAVGVFGPRFAEYGDAGLVLSDLSIYLSVEITEDDLDDDMIDDLFHLVVLEVRESETYINYTEFEEYSGSVEDQLPEGVRPVSVEWNS